MKTCNIGVVGVGRGSSLFGYCKIAENAKIVAICDKWEFGLNRARNELGDKIKYYTDFHEFLKNDDMDTVVLANYATEHAPFAIACMNAGKNVVSEVLPAQNMAEAVELIECVEKTGKQYIYAENYCFMGGPRKMKELYEEGKLGTFEYAEGEYMHNCEPIWHEITSGDPEHWRNTMSAFFYCTHSAGPILHITGMRPVKVTGFEGVFNARMARMGAKAGHNAVEMFTLENGAICKSLHGVGPSKNSIWYSVYGSKGRAETAREDTYSEDTRTTYINLDQTEGITEWNVITERQDEHADFGHGGSDYVCLHNAFDKILGMDADIVDVYEAIDMWMIGQFAYFSVLEGGISKDIPNLRNKSERDKYRHDYRCTDKRVAEDQLLPSYSKGNPNINATVYANIKKKRDEQLRMIAEEEG